MDVEDNVQRPVEVNGGEEQPEQEDDVNEMDDDELYKMLEEDVENPNEKKEEPIVPTRMKQKHIMVDKGTSKFIGLPPGWIRIVHNSGLPVFLHKETRVVTASRPYYIGTTNVRVGTF